MTEKQPKRPRDLNQWAKRMVDLATMDDQERAALKEKKSPEPESGSKPGIRGSSLAAARRNLRWISW
jgi:hypothetical protein